MNKRKALLVSIALALAGCGSHRELSLAQVRSPEPSWINTTIATEGYFQPHIEEDLLTRERHRFSDMVELSFEPMMADVPQEKRLVWRTALGEKLGGKWVLVRGRLKVGPFGMLNRPTI